MPMSGGLVASRILCKQDDIIPRHLSVKMSKRKHENKGRTLLDFFGKKLKLKLRVNRPNQQHSQVVYRVKSRCDCRDN